MLDIIAFDADDTLWHNEVHFRDAEGRFAAALADLGSEEEIRQAVYETESRNVGEFGFGVKGFTLSMFETALRLNGGVLPAGLGETILDLARTMLRAPVEILPGAAEAVDELRGDRRMIVLTKGDLHDQESKFERSGLADHFERCLVVARKDEATYARIFDELGVAPDRVLMVGNSLRSDIAPTLALGCVAVHCPYVTEWAYERADIDREHPRFHSIESLRELPALVRRLEISDLK